MSAQKALPGSETETRLLGGAEDFSVSPTRGHWFAHQAIWWFLSHLAPPKTWFLVPSLFVKTRKVKKNTCTWHNVHQIRSPQKPPHRTLKCDRISFMSFFCFSPHDLFSQKPSSSAKIIFPTWLCCSFTRCISFLLPNLGFCHSPKTLYDQSKMDHDMKTCTSEWCQNLCEFLFEAISVFGKVVHYYL